MRNEIICGDALSVLKTLPDEYIQTCVTSPPYFGLRDYGTGQWEGGNLECEHKKNPPAFSEKTMAKSTIGAHANTGHAQEGYKTTCAKCGATRIDQQIGLENTPEEYINRLVEVFREVRRVLRPDGTLWLNIGDSYAGSMKGMGADGSCFAGEKQSTNRGSVGLNRIDWAKTGLKEKDLIGIPWMLAFALRADGWYLRQEIIWQKPNCMPESVEDRCTKSHESLFLFAKSAYYYYDAESIKEPARDWGTRDRSQGKYTSGVVPISGGAHHGLTNSNNASTGRNKRSVWTISTMNYSEAHFATFPPKLVEPCILAGSSVRACEICNAPWKRIVEHIPMLIRNGPKAGGYGSRTTDDLSGTMLAPAETRTIGWEPTCKHKNKGIGKSIVLDPFMGAGTVALVAIQHGRDYLGIELNPKYVSLAQKRIACVQPDLWTVEGEVAV